MADLFNSKVNALCAIVVKTQIDQKSLNDLLSPTPSAGSPAGGAADAWDYSREVADFFASIADGAFSAAIQYGDAISTGQATGTITFTGNPANSDTITLAGVVVTFVTGTPSGSQVKIGASQAATMANLIAFINANGSANNLIGLVNAVLTSANVITITSIYPGLVGNLITTAKSCANISAITSPLAGGALTTQGQPVSVGV